MTPRIVKGMGRWGGRVCRDKHKKNCDGWEGLFVGHGRNNENKGKDGIRRNKGEKNGQWFDWRQGRAGGRRCQ